MDRKLIIKCRRWSLGRIVGNSSGSSVAISEKPFSLHLLESHDFRQYIAS
jgi:hypothetical protein